MRRTTRTLIIVIVGVVVVAGVIWYLQSRNGAQAPSSSVGSNGFLPTVGTGGAGGTGGANGANGVGSTGAGNVGAGGFGGTGGAGGISGTPAQGPAAKFGVAFGEQVLNYFVNASNTIIAVEPDGKIAEIANGQSTYLNSSKIANVNTAQFSYDGGKILVGFGSAQNPQWSVFDVASKSWTPLSVNALTAAWSPYNYEIAYFDAGASGDTLETLDLANAKAKPKTYFSMPGEDYTLLWPSTSTLMISDRPSAYFSGSIYSFNLKTATLATVVQTRVGLEAKWNSDGTMAVVSAGSNLVRGGQLGIIDGNGDFLHLMTFLTLPSKCAFTPPTAPAPAVQTASSSAASTTTSTVPTVPALAQAVICAIPRDTSALSNAPLPDAYNEKLVTTIDGIYSISLADGSVTTLYNDPSQSLDVSNAKIFNNMFFFVNRYDQKLYALSLGGQ